MKADQKMWLIVGLADICASLFVYFITLGSSLVFITIVPTILFLAICLPLQRTMNQITRIINQQNGKCYNCNLLIIQKDVAVLEDNNHVYCADCDKKLYGHTYVNRGGVEYKK